MKILKNIFLKNYTSFKIGGPAYYFCRVSQESELEEVINFIEKTKIPYFILGEGTNLLISEKGFPGLVIKSEIKEINIQHNIVEVGSGLRMQEFLKILTKHNLSGLEWAGGLPGTIGGAIRGNAGAFKGEIKDFIKEVRIFDFRKNNFYTLSAQDCKFQYRNSIFKQKSSFFIISAQFIFKKEKSPEKIILEIKKGINFRKTKHPSYPSAGSVFKNIPLEKFSPKWRNFFKEKKILKNDPYPLVPVAYLIDYLGLKGHQIGKAQISTKHPNFIINKGGAKFNEIISLIQLIKEKIQNEFEVEPELEIEILNF